MLIEITYFYQNFFKASSVLNKLRFCKKFLRAEISLALPFRLRSYMKSWDIQELKHGIICMLVPFAGFPVLLHLTTTHLTGMLYFLTAVPVFELEEIFLELHTYFLVSSYLVNPRNSSFVSERLPRETLRRMEYQSGEKMWTFPKILKKNNLALISQNVSQRFS